ncbi:serine/threonine-protein kinase [Saccharothrix violaceirubra]|uniref:non-specific serine/threonine protein kinase n=1 Tax=Saccharothrix violaceirubra TaxID=413306 RepID=A0A7W7T1A2_9PSEU|nr:serine/threonine-protein kinase [Saccharothrix violaceirubra]MBB4964739.1 hypothetical protein [Saccharothrix violaceirubra]
MWDGDLTGEVLNSRYAVGGLYGAGGMAEVYRAFDTRMDRRVAIKVFQGDAASEERVRLDREARMLASLHCPGVVAVYDTGIVRGRPYYVMQPIDGGTLRRRMREPIAPSVVARIGAQVAEILAAVHAHDIVHRDVKPSNILLDLGERRAYLADFGLALQGQLTRVTRTGVLVGTAGYLSPEQVRGGDVTAASDVYALGLVLLECLTGWPEYPGGDTESALARLHREPCVPAGLPASLTDVLVAMTSSVPGNRPTADVCVRRLVRAERDCLGLEPLSGDGVVTRPEPPADRRRSVRVLAGVAAVVGVLAVAGALLCRGTPPVDERSAPGIAATRTSATTPGSSTVDLPGAVPEEPVAETTPVRSGAAVPETLPPRIGSATVVEPTEGTTAPEPPKPTVPAKGKGNGKGKPKG